MDNARQFAQVSRAPGQQLALNIIAALRVAGPMRDDGKAGPLRAVAVQQDTGIARSTLRALKNMSGKSEPNPDLRTLCRLADFLGIPVAFLLMRPKDWDTMRLAIDGIRDPLRAADRLIGDRNFGGPEIAEKVLKECGVHPERPPLGAYTDEREQARLSARNEWRRRTSHVVAAIAQPAACNRAAHVVLTAFAASFANQATPSDPANS